MLCGLAAGLDARAGAGRRRRAASCSIGGAAQNPAVQAIARAGLRHPGRGARARRVRRARRRGAGRARAARLTGLTTLRLRTGHAATALADAACPVRNRWLVSTGERGAARNGMSTGPRPEAPMAARMGGCRPPTTTPRSTRSPSSSTRCPREVHHRPQRPGCGIRRCSRRPHQDAAQADRPGLGGRPARARGPARRSPRALGCTAGGAGGPRCRRAVAPRQAAPCAGRGARHAGGRTRQGRRCHGQRSSARRRREDDQRGSDGCRRRRRGHVGRLVRSLEAGAFDHDELVDAVGGSVPGATQPRTRDDLAERRARKAAEKAVREAERAANEAERELGQLEERRDRAQERADHVAERIDDLRRDLERLEAENATLTAELSRLSEEHGAAASRARSAAKAADRARRALEE